jgi:hypothetical protein
VASLDSALSALVAVQSSLVPDDGAGALEALDVFVPTINKLGFVPIVQTQEYANWQALTAKARAQKENFAAGLALLKTGIESAINLVK